MGLLHKNQFCQHLVVDVLLNAVSFGLPDPEPPMIKILQRWSGI